MRKLLSIALSAILGICSMHAQHTGRFLDLQLGGGMHSLQYHKLDQGRNNYGAGGQFNVAYRYMFHPNWGFGVGFELNYSHAELDLDGTRSFKSEKSGLDYTYKYENFREHNNFMDLNIPVQMLFQTSIDDRWSFICGLGVKLAFYEYNNFAASGSIDDGNGRIDNFKASGSMTIDLPTIGCDAVVDLGFHYAFNERMALYTGIYAAYGLTNHKIPSERPLYGGEELPYGGVMGSDVCPYANSVSVGVKIGFTYSLPNRSSLEEEESGEAPDPFSVAY